jgi:DNA-binding transcriptional ArsR family regulator
MDVEAVDLGQHTAAYAVRQNGSGQGFHVPLLPSKRRPDKSIRRGFAGAGTDSINFDLFNLSVECYGRGFIFNQMVEYSDASLDRIFSALSDPTRRAMLRRLAGGERTVGELAQPFDMSFAAAAKHVKVLEEAGLLHRTIDGRSHRCRLQAGPLAEADRWLAYYQRFWSLRLDDLETALTRHHAKKRSRK